jgi:hypothetical protein
MIIVWYKEKKIEIFNLEIQTEYQVQTEIQQFINLSTSKSATSKSIRYTANQNSYATINKIVVDTCVDYTTLLLSLAILPNKLIQLDIICKLFIPIDH